MPKGKNYRPPTSTPSNPTPSGVVIRDIPRDANGNFIIPQNAQNQEYEVTPIPRPNFVSILPQNGAGPMRPDPRMGQLSPQNRQYGPPMPANYQPPQTVQNKPDPQAMLQDFMTQLQNQQVSAQQAAQAEIERRRAEAIAQLQASQAQVRQMVGDAQNRITPQIDSLRTESGSAYDQAIKTLQSNAEAEANKQMAPYLEAVQGLQSNLQNLDVNFADTGIAQDYAKDTQFLQDASKAAVTQNLSTLESLKATDQTMYNEMVNQLALMDIALAQREAEQMQQAQLADYSGGLGGSGGSGTGSQDQMMQDLMAQFGGLLGNQDFSAQSDEQIDYYNPGFIQNLGTLQPSVQALAQNYLNQAGSGGVLEALSLAQEDYNKLMSPLPQPKPTSGNGGPFNGLIRNVTNTATNAYYQSLAQRREREAADLAALIQYATQYSPNYTPTVTSQSAQNKGNFKTPKFPAVNPNYG